MKEVHTDNVYKISTETVKAKFIFRYCCTIFSYQGLTLKNKTNEPIKKLKIFEWNHPHFSRNYFWVAITGCAGLKNVYFYNEKEDTSKDDELMLSYFKNKINGYKEQDKTANRSINKDKYITTEFFMNRKSNICSYCDNDFDIYIDNKNKKVKTDITAHRHDNSRSHEIDNCKLCCLHCNVSQK